LRAGVRRATVVTARGVLRAGDLAGAEMAVRTALEHETNRADVHNSLGTILERKGDLEGAEKEFAKALAVRV
jgi:Flp pilus assembly protein TadD